MIILPFKKCTPCSTSKSVRARTHSRACAHGANNQNTVKRVGREEKCARGGEEGVSVEARHDGSPSEEAAKPTAQVEFTLLRDVPLAQCAAFQSSYSASPASATEAKRFFFCFVFHGEFALKMVISSIHQSVRCGQRHCVISCKVETGHSVVAQPKMLMLRLVFHAGGFCQTCAAFNVSVRLRSHRQHCIQSQWVDAT